jgi:hypothetical protein
VTVDGAGEKAGCGVFGADGGFGHGESFSYRIRLRHGRIAPLYDKPVKTRTESSSRCRQWVSIQRFNAV